MLLKTMKKQARKNKFNRCKEIIKTSTEIN